MSRRLKREPQSDEDYEPSPVAPKKPKITRSSSRRKPENKENKAENAPATPPEDDSHNEIPSVRPKTTGRSSFWGRRKVWTIPELLAETQGIEPAVAQNIVKLFEDDNTIPFICRYRRDLVPVDSDRLREIKGTYTEIVDLRKKAEKVVSQLQRSSVIDTEAGDALLAAKSAEEFEFLYEPYKPAAKGTLAQRAIALGLEPHADSILQGTEPRLNPSALVRKSEKDLDKSDKVLQGICNIISSKIAKNGEVLEEVRRLRHSYSIQLTSKKARQSSSKQEKGSGGSGGSRHDESAKFENYFQFQKDVRYMQPHQVLAVNRGEKLKILSVKVVVPEQLKRELHSFVRRLFYSEGCRYALREELIEKSFQECYSKKLEPLIVRQIRSDLNEKAQKSSIEVFGKNLKELLLTCPLKGQRILGIDPGFRNGCKMAVISETADVLDTAVMYPHTNKGDLHECGQRLVKMLTKHGCQIIAIGNGTACRETETWIASLFDSNMLDSSRVKYTIVSEQGASIYSCSDVAKKEFPDMDVNLISAVSIARRLNDPLSEYTKIEPRHLGVGMYQHDLQAKALTETLNEVVSECVSFVGVDLNTASLSLLKHVAGLSEKKAEKILQHRSENGPFLKREQLEDVKTIGSKTFNQCAGFLRIEPSSVGGRLENPLDRTWIHPESYAVAKAVIAQCKLDIRDLGSSRFIERVKEFSADKEKRLKIVAKYGIPEERLFTVLTALQRDVSQDFRSDVDKRPLFKCGITKMSDLSVGEVISGAVVNVCTFGAFVDIGLEVNGLIHSSKMNGTILKNGDRVCVSILKLDPKAKRIQLQLEDSLKQTDTSFGFQ